MSRYSRMVSLIGVGALVSSLLALGMGAAPAHANRSNFIYYVDTALDTQLDGSNSATACADDAQNKDCSLRQALQLAASDGGASQIILNIPSDIGDPDFGYAGGYWEIQPQTELPAITSSDTKVVGVSGSGKPRVIINGAAIATLGGSGNGLTVSNASNTVIEYLALINFPTSSSLTGAGILVSGEGAGGTEILGSYIGVDPRTNAAAGNRRAGVLIDDRAVDTRIGLRASNGTIAPNVIAGNGGGAASDGILLQSARATAIIGNLIGVIPSDVNSAPLANSGYGIRIINSADTVIGGASAASMNTISSNTLGGIFIEGAGSRGNNIYANYIGTNRLGDSASPNGGHGVQMLNGANGNSILGFSAAQPIISGNSGYGVLISGAGTSGNSIARAYIGVNQAGISAIANALGGVRLQDNASSNLIGTESLGSVISGNVGYGISIGRTLSGFTQTSGNRIRNNLIGLNPAGTAEIANTVGGVLVDSSALNTIIGGLAGSEGNTIAGNGPASGSPTGAGIVINATGVLSTTVAGNTIGLRRATSNGPLSVPAGNRGGGVLVSAGAAQVQIGGTLEQANTIGSNIGNGVQVNSGVSALQITANSVLTNTLAGIVVTGALTPTLRANLIQGSQSGAGLSVTSSPGAQINENTAVGNLGGAGIVVASSSRASITANIANTNSGGGISVATSDDTLVGSNTALSNTGAGIDLSGGARLSVESNNARLNSGAGIQVRSSASRVTLSANIARSNGAGGIALTSTSTFTVTSNTLRSNTGGAGLSVTGPGSNGRITTNQVIENGQSGILISGPSATTALTITGNTIQRNTGSGLLLSGSVSVVRIQANQVISNTLDGIHLGVGGAGPHPQRVRIFDNVLNRNGIPAIGPFPVGLALQRFGIVFNPSNAAPGSASSPNHDIDAPIEASLAVSQNGTVTGRVRADGSPSACTTSPPSDCTIHIYETNTETLDGQGVNEVTGPLSLTSNGYFTSTIGFVPPQLAITATDRDGNTSEFAIFNATPSLAISPPIITGVRPGQLITLTHRITNTGNIGFTRLRLSAASSRDRWTLTQSPGAATNIALPVGASQLVTVSVRLPLGTDSQAAAGLTGLITTTLDASSLGPDRLTARVTDQLTVQRNVVLGLTSATPQSGKPGTQLSYRHTVTNSGNATTTINFSTATTVGGLPAPTWASTTSPPSLVLTPGQSGVVDVLVTVSAGASAGPPATVAVTTLTATPSVDGTPDLTQVRTAQDTTTTLLDQKSTLAPNRNRDAAAEQTVVVDHTITNTSNGTATFRIVATTTQGSAVSFTLPSQSGVEVLGPDLVRISAQPGLNTYTFSVSIVVARPLLAGEQEFVTVTLRDLSGNQMANSSAVTTINVTRGVLYPRLWLPLTTS